MKRIINIIIVIVLIAATAGLGWITYGYRDWDVKNWGETLSELKPQSRGEYDSNGAIKYEIADNNNLMLSFQKTLDTADNEAKRTIQATVYPQNATNQNVDWTIAWQESEREANYVVTDYVNLTTEVDGSTVATINCINGFRDNPIIITCTTRDGGFVATCKLTFIGVPTSIEIYAGGWTHIIPDDQLLWGNGYMFKETNYWDDVGTSANGFDNRWTVEASIRNKINYGIYTSFDDFPEDNYITELDEYQDQCLPNSTKKYINNERGLSKLATCREANRILFANLDGMLNQTYSTVYGDAPWPDDPAFGEQKYHDPESVETDPKFWEKWFVITSIENPEQLIVDITITSDVTGLQKKLTLIGNMTMGVEGVDINPNNVEF